MSDRDPMGYTWHVAIDNSWSGYFDVSVRIIKAHGNRNPSAVAGEKWHEFEVYSTVSTDGEPIPPAFVVPKHALPFIAQALVDECRRMNLPIQEGLSTLDTFTKDTKGEATAAAQREHINDLRGVLKAGKLLE